MFSGPRHEPCVPQGSCLGPLMFIIFSIDLPRKIPVDVITCQYADDTKLYSIGNPDKLQDGINALYNWSLQWHLPVNVTKTFVFIIGEQNSRRYMMNGE